MLILKTEEAEVFNNLEEQFENIPGRTVSLEHSLVSVSKWERRWKKPFLTIDEKTPEELLDYIRAMTITQKVPETFYAMLSKDSVNTVIEYINNSMTATTFSDSTNRPSREVITSEIIYYWVIAFNIPIECQKWHLNRLLTLIKVCSIKNNPKGQHKLSNASLKARKQQLNAERRAKLKSEG